MYGIRPVPKILDFLGFVIEVGLRRGRPPSVFQGSLIGFKG
jgi:hypothetical protein